MSTLQPQLHPHGTHRPCSSLSSAGAASVQASTSGNMTSSALRRSVGRGGPNVARAPSKATPPGSCTSTAEVGEGCSAVACGSDPAGCDIGTQPSPGV